MYSIHIYSLHSFFRAPTLISTYELIVYTIYINILHIFIYYSILNILKVYE